MRELESVKAAYEEEIRELITLSISVSLTLNLIAD